jgi:hypothetical protein
MGLGSMKLAEMPFFPFATGGSAAGPRFAEKSKSPELMFILGVLPYGAV